MFIHNPSPQKAETGVSLWVQGQPRLYGEFQDILGYKIERPCLKTIIIANKQNQTNNNKDGLTDFLYIST